MEFEQKTSLLSRNSACSFNQSEGKHFQIQCKDRVSYFKNPFPGVRLRRALALGTWRSLCSQASLFPCKDEPRCLGWRRATNDTLNFGQDAGVQLRLPLQPPSPHTGSGAVVPAWCRGQSCPCWGRRCCWAGGTQPVPSPWHSPQPHTGAAGVGAQPAEHRGWQSSPGPGHLLISTSRAVSLCPAC